MAEADGRSVSYSYDALYRLTGETITGDQQGVNGAVSYNYDDVGNRLNRTSTLPGITVQTSAYDKNDRLTTDTYDQNGNTRQSNGSAYTYDFENRLTSVNGGSVIYAYDGDGNRVSKTVGGITTTYLVDTNNLTGYAQVVEELQGGSVTRQYTYGTDLISQRQIISGNWTTHFYGYDGHGSVRLLTDSTGTVTDAYTYDAFGTLIARTGATPNEYLYAGERFDAETGMYQLRARYMRPDTSRFWSMDSFEGNNNDPLSLHKYLYAGGDPANKVDPSGNNYSLADQMMSVAMQGIIIAMTAAVLLRTLDKVKDRVSSPWDAIPTSAPLERVSPFPLPAPQPSPTPSPKKEPHPVGEGENQMRVQLQEGDNRDKTYGIRRMASPSSGVSVRQVRNALAQLYEDIPSKANWFPLRKLEDEFFAGVIYLSQRLGTFPPGGIIQGGQIKGMRYEIPDGRFLYRIEIENLRGHNLRF